jgi:hypothetical protein
MDDDELTVSSHTSMDEIRRMVAEAQASMGKGQQASVAPSNDDGEATVEADARVMEQIRAGRQMLQHQIDDESTFATAPGWPSAAPVPPSDTPPRLTPPPIAPGPGVTPPPPPAPPAPPRPAPVAPEEAQVEQPFVIAPSSATPTPPSPPPHAPARLGVVSDPAGATIPHVHGERWQPPARLVNPREREAAAPHQQISRWKLVSAGLGILLVAALAVAVFGLLGGDESPSVDTTVDGSTPVTVATGGPESELGG